MGSLLFEDSSKIDESRAASAYSKKENLWTHMWYSNVFNACMQHNIKLHASSYHNG